MFLHHLNINFLINKLEPKNSEKNRSTFRNFYKTTPQFPILMNFNEKVYNLCRKIPKGKVSTYKLIAEKLNSRAYRAVGNALNRNPYSPEVPCHRVVGSDGRLVGFAHGIGKKKAMLSDEGIALEGEKIVNLEKVLHRF